MLPFYCSNSTIERQAAECLCFSHNFLLRWWVRWEYRTWCRNNNTCSFSWPLRWLADRHLMTASTSKRYYTAIYLTLGASLAWVAETWMIRVRPMIRNLYSSKLTSLSRVSLAILRFRRLILIAASIEIVIRVILKLLGILIEHGLAVVISPHIECYYTISSLAHFLNKNLY